MKTVIRPVQLILAIFSIFLLAACGGGDGSSPGGLQEPAAPGGEPAKILLEGRVADGYLVDARVFLDRNGNKIADGDEPITLSGPGGRFRLAVAPGEDQLYPVVVQVLGGTTLDEDDNAPVELDYPLEAPIGAHTFISPLSTLIKQEMDKNASFKARDAANLVRARLGLDNQLSLAEDYIALKNQAGTAAAAERAHQTAQVVAQISSILLEQFRQNLGGNILPEDYRAATVLVGDLLMQNAGEIALAVAPSVTSQTFRAKGIVETLLARIDVDSLNRGRLQTYRKLLANRPRVWDASPPRILSQAPAADAEAPVTSAIIVTFDEALDPATIDDTSLMVTGSGTTFEGTIDYDEASRSLTLTPFQPLFAYGRFTVVVADTLTDKLGNPLGSAKTWEFSTIFDQSPPELPNF